MSGMEKTVVKPWEWVVAGVLMLLSFGRVAWVAAGYSTETTIMPVRLFFDITGGLQTVVLLWAVWCIYRMAKWQERKSTVLLVFFLVLLMEGVLQYFPVGSGVTTAIGMVAFVAGIVAAVRLFIDNVKPLGTVMVLYVVVPMVINLLVPIVIKAGMTVAYALAEVLSTVLVVLMFLFRNAPGDMEEED